MDERADGDVGAPGDAPGEWYSRGYLPHRDTRGLLQSITFRLEDGLPKEKLVALEEELRKMTDLKAGQIDAERRRRIEELLDAGMG